MRQHRVRVVMVRVFAKEREEELTVNVEMAAVVVVW